MYGCDRQGFVNSYLQGKGQAPVSYFFPDWVDKSSINLYAFDQTKAKSLLDEAKFDYSKPVVWMSWNADAKDRQAFLHRAVAVGRRVVVDRGAASLDRFCQHRPDRPVEPCLIRRAKALGATEGVQACLPEGLVGVDVANAGEEGLIEQQRLEAALPPPEAGAESPQREFVRQGLRAVLAEQVAGRRRRRYESAVGLAPVHPHAPELAHVAEAQLAAIGQVEDDPHMAVEGSVGGRHEDLAGHLQLDRQGELAAQLEEHELRTPPDRFDAPARHPTRELPGWHAGDGSRPVKAPVGDDRSHDEAAEVAGDGLDLRELRHGRSASWPPSCRRSSTPRRAARRGASRSPSSRAPRAPPQ